MAFSDFREFLKELEQRKQLVKVGRSVAPEFEVAAGIRKISDTNGPALLFENVKGHDMAVAGGLYANRERAYIGLETRPETAMREIGERIRRPVTPVRVNEGVCQERVFTGDEVDLGRLPICIYSPKDGGKFVTAGVQIAKDPVFGYNLSMHRCMVLGRKRLGIFLATKRQHLAQYFQRAEARGEVFEVATVIGVTPDVIFASQIKGSIETDEYGCAGGLRKGEPLEVVRCKTVDIVVPSHAEIVIEGIMPFGVLEKEGPFGEYPGYYGPASMSPVVEVTAVTMRKNAIYEAQLTGKPVTDNHVLKDIPRETLLYDRLLEVCPGVKGVYITPCAHHAVISMKPLYPGHAKKVLYAALTMPLGMKHVVVVDEDINIFNPLEVEWAIAYRAQADRDVIILPNLHGGGSLDPSAIEGMTAGMGIDATIPFGKKFAEVVEIPGADRFEVPGFPADVPSAPSR